MDKILFVGAGAVGASYAASMVDHGIDVSILVNEERKSRYEKQAFVINGKDYKFKMLTPKQAFEMDFIFVSVKFHHLSDVIKEMQDFVGFNTKVISLMNGINSEEILSKAFSKDQVIHAYAIKIDALRNQMTISYKNKGKIVFGDYYSQDHMVEKEIQAILNKADIENEISDNILYQLWWKFLVNVGINQTSAILNGPYGLFQESEYARQLMIDSMKEVIELSKAVGINLKEDAIEAFLQVLDTLGPELKTSMLQDVDAKRKTEVEMLAGEMIRLGKLYHVPTPINDLYYKMIKSIETRNNMFKELLN